MSNPNLIDAYPLQWPAGVPRTPHYKRTKPQFLERTWTSALAELRNEVRLLGGTQLVLSTNQPLRNDGQPYAATRRIEDPGVAVYFTLDGMPLCLPCDRWNTIGLNIRAVAMHLDAMRAMARWGVGSAKQHFSGFKALTSGTPVEHWWDVLECRADASLETIEAQYRARLRAAHPDTGGSSEAMARLNLARDRAKAELHS